ncbi:hypothetical protein R84B8_01228 [Treponema sp. R8-4-B8]
MEIAQISSKALRAFSNTACIGAMSIRQVIFPTVSLVRLFIIGTPNLKIKVSFPTTLKGVIFSTLSFLLSGPFNHAVT